MKAHGLLTFVEESHEYFLDEKPIPSVTRILQVDPNPWWDPRGAQRGVAVHSSIDFLLDRDLDWGTVAPETKPYIGAFLRFVRDVAPKVIAKEMRVFSREHWYAGRFDLFVKCFGQRLLIDIKTGMIPDWAPMQLEAYRWAMEESLGFRPQGTRILQLRKDTSYKLLPGGHPGHAWAAFLKRRREYDERAA